MRLLVVILGLSARSSEPDLDQQPTMQLVRVSEPGPAWDDFVRSQPYWNPFHCASWHAIMGQVFGHECFYMSAQRGHDIVGVLPLVRVRSRLFGHYLVSMPFLNYGGPLGEVEAVEALVDDAVARAARENVTLLQLRSSVELPIALAASHHKITVVLKLPPEGSEAAWKHLTAKVRSQVRRPQKAGATAQFGPEQLKPFYEVFARNMRDLGTPVLPRRFFEALRAHLGESVWFGCIYMEGKPVAAGCGFRWANEFEMTWASSLREFNTSAPNMLLYWSFIEKVAASGATRFNFGRCTPGSGTHRFKQQWGGDDEPLWWYGYPDVGARTPSQVGPFALAARLWSHLPVSIATALGPRIVRSIP